MTRLITQILEGKSMNNVQLPDVLITSLIPLTILVALFLIFHQLLSKKLGVINVYRLWGIIPLGVIAYSFPIKWGDANSLISQNINQYIVQPTTAVQEQFSSDWLISVWLITVWLLGMVIIVSHTLWMYGQFRRHLDLHKIESYEKFCGELDIKLPLRLSLYQCKQTFSPMLIGLFKQKLVLPEYFCQLYNKEQQQLILQHEICHFDRNDIYWNLLAYCMIVLFWFHPLVWLAYYRYRRDQELSCDQIVLARKQTRSRINYSKALLVVAEKASPFAFAQLSFKKYGDKEIMFERIKQIQLNTTSSKLSVSLVALLSITLMSGLSYAGSIGEHKAEQQLRTPPKEAQQHRIPPKSKEQVKPIYRVEPKYPIKAAQENIEGAVVLRFDVDDKGSVRNVEVLNGVPAYVFDRVAIAALEQWEYEAKGIYHKNLLVQLDFRLDQDSTFKNIDLIEKIKVTQ